MKVEVYLSLRRTERFDQVATPAACLWTGKWDEAGWERLSDPSAGDPPRVALDGVPTLNAALLKVPSSPLRCTC